jgi:sulfatase maturation enzyme AslB (radical SAM superfamily)
MPRETRDAGPIRLDWLNIEFTSRCNLRCKWCSLDFDKASVHLDETLLAKTLDQLAAPPGIEVGEIALHNGGETLLHPRLPSMLAVIAEKRRGRSAFPTVTLLTNGVLLNDAKGKAILASGAIDLLRVSVDGGSVAAFEEIRTPAKWSRVRDNIYGFVALNNAAARRIRTGVICVVPPDRPLTIDWMEQEFQDVLLAVDGYELRHPHNWDGSKDLGLVPRAEPEPLPLQLYRNGRAMLRQARDFVEARPAVEHQVCKFLTSELVVLPDGRVTVCCADLNARGVIGDLGANSLREIFDSEGRAAMVDAFRRGDKASIPLCKDCAGYYD